MLDETRVGTEPAADPFDTRATHTEVQFDLALRLGERLWVEATIPYVRKTLDNPGLPNGGVPGHPDVPHKELSGIGDVRLWERFRLVEGLILGLGMQLPTGETVENPYAKESSGHTAMQIGTGTVNSLFEVYFDLQTGPVEPFVDIGGVVVTYPNEHGYQAGDQLLGAMGITWPILQARIRPRSSLVLWWRGKDELDILTEDTGGTSLYVEAGIEARVVSALSLSAGLRWPVYQQVNSLQLVEDIYVFSGISVASSGVSW